MLGNSGSDGWSNFAAWSGLDSSQDRQNGQQGWINQLNIDFTISFFIFCIHVFDNAIKEQLQKSRQTSFHLREVDPVEDLALLVAHLHLPDHAQGEGAKELQCGIPDCPRGGVEAAETDLCNVGNLWV